MADAGWIWEGQGLDPGVYPSIFGIGEGAEFFGLRKARFLFHPTTELALGKLSKLEAVTPDISKWIYKDVPSGGSVCAADATLETQLAEANKVGWFSKQFANITGAYFDDMKGLMEREQNGLEALDQIRTTLRRHNANLELHCVVYSHELEEPAFWAPLAHNMDVISFWFWGYERLERIDEALKRCRDIFPEKPVYLGCYLRDYPTKSPMPMDSLRKQWLVLERALATGIVQGYEVLATVLIDGHLEQATWVRDFIRANS
ncbi:MAG: hypothetical protein KJ052_21240 [Candidatus Hydrogenedentes bacterium]|nr:hypothetical protein [Candidatus Hydrogenedentota bacterium]